MFIKRNMSVAALTAAELEINLFDLTFSKQKPIIFYFFVSTTRCYRVSLIELQTRRLLTLICDSFFNHGRIGRHVLLIFYSVFV